jgi:hypothetical protein
LSTTLPLNFTHTDRRPIGIDQIGDDQHRSDANPGSWVLQGEASNIDVRTPAGVADFQKRLLMHADAVVEQLRRLNAQGSATWGIDGGKFGTYLGSPDIACDLNPELNGAVDQYFQRLGADGRKTGGTVRADELNRATGLMERSANPLATLTRKINYAYRRWKWRIFYIDSNLWDPFNSAPPAPRILPPTIYATLRKKFPGCLFIPEHAHWGGSLPAASPLFDQLATYRDASPYLDMTKGPTGTPALIRQSIPDAFSCLNINTTSQILAANFDNLVAAFRAGDIPLISAWHPFESIDTLIEILRAAAAQGASR